MRCASKYIQLHVQAIGSSDAKVVAIAFLMAEDANKIIPNTTVNQGTMVVHGICGIPYFLSPDTRTER